VLPNAQEIENVRHQLRLLRAYIARFRSGELGDLEALLSVAEAELDRVTPGRGQQPGQPAG
jgi:hypothetical protein